MLIDLLPELPGWQLVVAGDGPMRPALEAQARSAGVADRVTLTGALPRAQVLGWYRRADACVLNTSFESFSYQLIEAMASGVPVIATPIGSIPELLTDGAEGILCAPNDKNAFRDAVLSITNEPSLWKVRTEAAVRKAHSFGAAASAAAFAQALKTVCE